MCVKFSFNGIHFYLQSTILVLMKTMSSIYKIKNKKDKKNYLLVFLAGGSSSDSSDEISLDIAINFSLRSFCFFANAGLPFLRFWPIGMVFAIMGMVISAGSKRLRIEHIAIICLQELYLKKRVQEQIDWLYSKDMGIEVDNLMCVSCLGNVKRNRIIICII